MKRRSAGLMIVATLATAPAWATDPGAQAPVRLRAERIEIDQKAGISRYRGQVVLTQGTLRITADQAEARGRREAVERIAASGHPVTFRYLAAGQSEVVEGEARRIDYDLVARRLNLSGVVEIRQGQDLLRAGTVDYDLAAERVTARSDSGQRIYAALAPRRRPESQPEAAP